MTHSRVDGSYFRSPNRWAKPAGMPALPKRFSPTVRIVPEIGVSEESELFIISAISELVRQNDRVRLVYGTRVKDLVPLLRDRWFLEDVVYVGEDATGRDWIVIEDPDPKAMHDHEKSLYDQKFKEQVTHVERLRELAKERGDRDVVFPDPIYQFVPKLNRGAGYLWQIGKLLGVPVSLPDGPIVPFCDFSRSVVREASRRVDRLGLLRSQTILYDFRSEPSAMAIVSALAQSLGGCQFLSVSEFEDLGLPGLISVVSNPNCHTVIGPIGMLTSVAWGVNALAGPRDHKPNVVEIYTGANPIWDSVRVVNSAMVDRSSISDEELPRAIVQAVVLAARRAWTGE